MASHAEKSFNSGLVSSKNLAFDSTGSWFDTSGQRINAHGGSILFHDGTYYWYGEDRNGPTLPSRACEYRTDVIGIMCYSSPDLRAWTDRGHVLRSVQETKPHDLARSGVVERPRVLYNGATREFVMWLHIDDEDYALAKAGVAVSSSPVGPFIYLGSLWPNGVDSRDLSVFQDDDGAGYLIYASDRNRTLCIARLDHTYRDVTGEYTRCLIDQSREAPIVFRANSAYHMITSGCTGWHPNGALHARADAMLGRWQITGNPCEGTYARTTFNSQGTHVFKVGAPVSTPIFMADRWVPNDLSASTYVLLPIEMDSDSPRIAWRDTWSLALDAQQPGERA